MINWSWIGDCLDSIKKKSHSTPLKTEKVKKTKTIDELKKERASKYVDFLSRHDCTFEWSWAKFDNLNIGCLTLDEASKLYDHWYPRIIASRELAKQRNDRMRERLIF